MLPSPLHQRHNIPFYIQKSATAFRTDPYESYDEHVIRQLSLHHGFPGQYQWQALENWMLAQLPTTKNLTILEVGCGVGKLIGRVAEDRPNSQCFGFDYSYQMLKAADDYYRSSKALNWWHPGFSASFHLASRSPLQNLHLGLADAANMPFPTGSIDVLLNSFLLDRIAAPKLALQEWTRLLKPGGILLTASPLNFQKQQQWERFYPWGNLHQQCTEAGLTIIDSPKTLLLRQSLDQHDNALIWKCYVWKMRKTA